jgi:hypothetical protein
MQQILRADGAAVPIGRCVRLRHTAPTFHSHHLRPIDSLFYFAYSGDVNRLFRRDVNIRSEATLAFAMMLEIFTSVNGPVTGF